MQTRMLKKARQKGVAEKISSLEQELRDSWRRREFSQMHRVRVRLAANGRGPKQRHYYRPQEESPSAEEWELALGKPGDQGGLGAIREDFEEVARGWEQDAAVEQISEREAQQLVTKDLKNIRRYRVKAPKRRSYPRWSAPTETWLQLLMPNYRAEGYKRGAGIGYTAEAVHPKRFFVLIREVLLKVRMTGCSPLNWNRSAAFASSKHNGKRGVVGLRLMHCFHCVGIGFFSGIAKT